MHLWGPCCQLMVYIRYPLKTKPSMILHFVVSFVIYLGILFHNVSLRLCEVSKSVFCRVSKSAVSLNINIIDDKANP